VRILTQKEVDALPVPAKHLAGSYKVPQNTYRNLLATAKRVGRVDSRERNWTAARSSSRLRKKHSNRDRDFP